MKKILFTILLTYAANLNASFLTFELHQKEPVFLPAFQEDTFTIIQIDFKLSWRTTCDLRAEYTGNRDSKGFFTTDGEWIPYSGSGNGYYDWETDPVINYRLRGCDVQDSGEHRLTLNLTRNENSINRKTWCKNAKFYAALRIPDSFMYLPEVEKKPIGAEGKVARYRVYWRLPPHHAVVDSLGKELWHAQDEDIEIYLFTLDFGTYYVTCEKDTAMIIHRTVFDLESPNPNPTREEIEKPYRFDGPIYL